MAGYQNYQVNRNKAYKGSNIFEKGNNFNKSSENMTKSEKLMEGVSEWTSFYRANPHRFAIEVLGASLKEFQQILLWQMFHNNYSMIMAARGLGKTWLTALYVVIRCILYPGTKVVIASGVKAQALKIVTEKIPELEIMAPMISREIKDVKTSTNSDDPNVLFHNGSWIKVVSSNENARSARANLLILDEFRLIDFDIYKNVLRRFLAVSRQPKYLKNKKYAHMQERNTEIFLSSCKYKFEWSYDKFKTFYSSMMDNKSYFVCGLPYQVSVMSGLVMRSQLEDEMNEDDFDEISFMMEMDTMFFGESEKAYFKLDKLTNNRKIKEPFYLPTEYNLLDKLKGIPKKEKGEKRILSTDIATMSGDANDASVFILIRLIPNKSNTAYNRYVTYIEPVVGGHTVTQSLRIRFLYEYFEVDFIALDVRNAGISIFDNLATELYDKKNEITYDPLTAVDDEKLAERCEYPNAEKVIYGISATEQSNSDMAVRLQDDILRGRLKFLVEDNDGEYLLYKTKGYSKLSLQDQLELQMPYKQTTLLINEMINLERVQNDKGLVKLKEPKSMRKDRYSSLLYGNWVASLIEKKDYKKEKKSKSWANYVHW